TQGCAVHDHIAVILDSPLVRGQAALDHMKADSQDGAIPHDKLRYPSVETLQVFELKDDEIRSGPHLECRYEIGPERADDDAGLGKQGVLLGNRELGTANGVYLELRQSRRQFFLIGDHAAARGLT